MSIDTTENFMWKLRGQVVDYYPPRLQDWILATCPVCETECVFLSDSHEVTALTLRCSLPDTCITCLDHNQVKLGYMFFLAVAEEPSAANGYTSPCDWITILPSSLPDNTVSFFFILLS